MAIVDDDGQHHVGTVSVTGAGGLHSEFADVPDEFALAEAEGDLNAEDFRASHTSYWSSVGTPVAADTLVVQLYFVTSRRTSLPRVASSRAVVDGFKHQSKCPRFRVGYRGQVASRIAGSRARGCRSVLAAVLWAPSFEVRSRGATDMRSFDGVIDSLLACDPFRLSEESVFVAAHRSTRVSLS